MFNTINTKTIKNTVNNLIHSAFGAAFRAVAAKSKFNGVSYEADDEVAYYVHGPYLRLACGYGFHAFEFGPQCMEYRITSVDDENGKRFITNRFFLYNIKDIIPLIKRALNPEVRLYNLEQAKTLDIFEAKNAILAYLRSNGMSNMQKLYEIAGMEDMTMYEAIHQLVVEGLIFGVDPKNRIVNYTYHTEVVYTAPILFNEHDVYFA